MYAKEAIGVRWTRVIYSRARGNDKQTRGGPYIRRWRGIDFSWLRRLRQARSKTKFETLPWRCYVWNPRFSPARLRYQRGLHEFAIPTEKLRWRVEFISHHWHWRRPSLKKRRNSDVYMRYIRSALELCVHHLATFSPAVASWILTKRGAASRSPWNLERAATETDLSGQSLGCSSLRKLYVYSGTANCTVTYDVHLKCILININNWNLWRQLYISRALLRV